jgi:GntR family transcriptional regulator
MHLGVTLPSKRPFQRALYLQVRDVLAERIASGVWKAGTPITNESDLAREIGVSAGTVRKALELMEEQRLISRRQGRGTFVNDQTSNEQTARFCNLRNSDGERMNGRVVSVEVAEGAVSEQEGLRLNLREGDPVYRIRRIRRQGSLNFLVGNVAVPAEVFPGLVGKPEVAGSISALAQAYGVLLGKQEVRISLGLAPADVAETLGVAAGTRMMLLQRVVFMLDGPPVECGTAHCHLPGGYYLAEMG